MAKISIPLSQWDSTPDDVKAEFWRQVLNPTQEEIEADLTNLLQTGDIMSQLIAQRFMSRSGDNGLSVTTGTGPGKHLGIRSDS